MGRRFPCSHQRASIPFGDYCGKINEGFWIMEPGILSPTSRPLRHSFDGTPPSDKTSEADPRKSEESRQFDGFKSHAKHQEERLSEINQRIDGLTEYYHKLKEELELYTQNDQFKSHTEYKKLLGQFKLLKSIIARELDKVDDKQHTKHTKHHKNKFLSDLEIKIAAVANFDPITRAERKEKKLRNELTHLEKLARKIQSIVYPGGVQKPDESALLGGSGPDIPPRDSSLQQQKPDSPGAPGVPPASGDEKTLILRPSSSAPVPRSQRLIKSLQIIPMPEPHILGAQGQPPPPSTPEQPYYGQEPTSPGGFVDPRQLSSQNSFMSGTEAPPYIPQVSGQPPDLLLQGAAFNPYYPSETPGSNWHPSQGMPVPTEVPLYPSHPMPEPVYYELTPTGLVPVNPHFPPPQKPDQLPPPAPTTEQPPQIPIIMVQSPTLPLGGGRDPQNTSDTDSRF
jgi:hypothetical protein